MEHGNSIQGEKGEKALVEAYLEACNIVTYT